jgi:hypothetical protein
VTTTTENDAAFGLPAPSSLLTRTLKKKQIEIQFSSVLTFGNGNEWFFFLFLSSEIQNRKGVCFLFTWLLH